MCLTKFSVEIGIKSVSHQYIIYFFNEAQSIDVF